MSAPQSGTPKVIAVIATASAVGGLIMLFGFVVFVVLVLACQSLMGESPLSSLLAVVRTAGASGVAGTLAALPFRHWLFRRASGSPATAVCLLIAGGIGMYALVPRTIIYMEF